MIGQDFRAFQRRSWSVLRIFELSRRHFARKTALARRVFRLPLITGYGYLYARMKRARSGVGRTYPTKKDAAPVRHNGSGANAAVRPHRGVRLLAWRAARRRRVWRAGATMPIAKVSAYQMALLDGGAARVALTGVVLLLARKALVAGIAGVLTRSAEFSGSLDLIEQEGLAAAAKSALLKDYLNRLEARLRRNGVIGTLRRELIAMGYMRARGSPAWWRHYASNMPPFLALNGAILGALLGLGMTDEGRLRLMAFGAASVATMMIIALPTRVTALGRYIIWSATQHHPDLKTARAMQGDAIDAKSLARSIALYGPDALAASDMAWIPAVLEHVDSSD
jgi:uncharacterized protein (TIGR04222 family)